MQRYAKDRRSRPLRGGWTTTLSLILAWLMVIVTLPSAQAQEPGGRSGRLTTSAANAVLTENFDGTGTPSGWSVQNNVGAVGWSFDNPGGRPNETGGQGNFAIADSDNAGGGVTMDTELRTPALDLSSSPTVQLKFQTYYRPFNASTADVDVSTDGGFSWQNVWQATTNERQGLITLDISAQAANQSNVIIRFRYYNATYEWYWQIDEVQVSGVSGMTAPSNLTALPLGSGNEIALEWQDNSNNETAFEIERSTSSGSGFTKIATTFADTTNFSNNQGITCGTTYYYRVRAINASGASDYSNEANAATAACAGATTLNENFEGQTTAPSGWNVAVAGWNFDDSDQFSSFLSGLTGNFAATTVQNSELRTPTLDLSSQQAVSLNFDTYLWGAGDIDVSSDGGATWQNVWRNSGNIEGSPLKSQTVDISAKAGGRSNVVIRFRAVTWVWWVVDNVALSAVSAPAAPTGLTATAGSNGAVNLSWTNPANSAIEVQRSQDNVTWATIFELAPGSTSFIDDNVVAGQTYYYRVRATSSAGNSAFSNVAQLQISSNVKTFDVIVSLYYSRDAASVPATRTAIENNFKYFADAVYEMSNGAHRIGKVSFYPDNGFRTTADIIWADNKGVEGNGKCWPNAYPGGRAVPFGPQYKRIEHCDVAGPISYIADEAGQRRGGYTLAHEWGHYFYNMYDEYNNPKKACDPNDPGGPCREDVGVQSSIMNQQYRAVNEGFKWLNFSTPQTFNQQNAQYRVFQASAWDVLTRPISQDPPYRWPRKVYYPELVNVKPAANQLPNIELPTNSARAALQLLWPSDTVIAGNGGELTAQQTANNTVRQIVIDRSANMSATQLDDVKNAVNLLIDQARDGSIFGIFAYGDGAVQQVQTPVTINGDADKTTLKNAVDGIAAPSGNSVTGDALQAAVDDLVNNGPAALNQVVYLITAGPYQAGAHPVSVVPDYQDASVSLFTFGYGVDDGVGTTLEQIATETGGFYRFVGKRSDLQKGLNAADKIASPVSPVYITLANEIVAANNTFNGTFYVDSTLGSIEVGVSYLNVLTEATISVFDPSNSQTTFSTAQNCEDWSGVDFDVETICYLTIDPVTAGEWTLRVEAGAEEVDALYWVDGIPAPGKNTYTVNLEVLSGEDVTYPEPILLRAAVGTDLPITGVNIQGEIFGPDGTSETFTLRDDGVDPDEKAQDGIYHALINYSSNGYHDISVAFDNSSLTGQFTDAGLLLARQFVGPGEDGTYPDVTFTTVSENFQRLGEIQVNITGLDGDDHADFLFDETNPATDLPLDNVAIAGQIDFADDSDTFKVTIPNDYEGELVVRVANLGFDMDPYLYFTAEDYSWEFEEFLDFVPTSTDYLNVPLTVGSDVTVKPGSTFFVQVYHFEESATEGTYTISAGPPLSGEVSSSADDTKGDSDIYLPLIFK